MIKEMDTVIEDVIRLRELSQKLEYYLDELDDLGIIDSPSIGNDSDTEENVIYLK